MDLDALRVDDDSTVHAEPSYAQVIAIPGRTEIQPAAKLFGDFIYPSLGLFDTKFMFTPDYHATGRHLFM